MINFKVGKNTMRPLTFENAVHYLSNKPECNWEVKCIRDESNLAVDREQGLRKGRRVSA